METQDLQAKRVLMVDDDPLVLRVYKESLGRHGLEVETVGDGLAAMKALRTSNPDVVVLDLMMPKFSGVEVLKFIRADPDLALLPVVVLSNSYMDDLARAAAAAGVQKSLLKVRCTPSILLGAIQEAFSSPPAAGGPEQGLALEAPLGAPELEPVAPAPEPAETPPPVDRVADEEALRLKARRDFLRNAEAAAANLRELFQACTTAQTPKELGLRVQDFYRRVHFLSAAAGLAQFHRLAQISTALEALLFQVLDQPARMSPSVSRTLAAAVEFMEELFRRAAELEPEPALEWQALVVDDEPLANRLVVWALRQAGLAARSVESPRAALQLLVEKHYDLILLDVELPEMDGFELCRRLRGLPGYEQVPVIYVTVHGDFEHRSQGALAGGNDLLAKPILPMELAVKAVMHLLKAQLPA
jgi:CheY-like chemotaxis protein